MMLELNRRSLCKSTMMPSGVDPAEFRAALRASTEQTVGQDRAALTATDMKGDALRGRRSGPNMHHHWRTFFEMLRDGQARLAFCSYFECFGGDGCPSRELWFQCNAHETPSDDDDDDAYEAHFAGLPAHEMDADGRFVSGLVILHVHYAGTSADPDYTRILHVNARMAVDVTARHAKNPCARFGFAIDGEGAPLPTTKLRTWLAMPPLSDYILQTACDGSLPV